MSAELATDKPVGEVMNFSLYGGPGDGGLVVYPLQAAGGVYLITLMIEELPGVREVWAYAWAGWRDRAGTWVLRCERFIGRQGLPTTEGGAP